MKQNTHKQSDLDEAEGFKNIYRGLSLNRAA